MFTSFLLNALSYSKKRSYCPCTSLMHWSGRAEAAILQQLYTPDPNKWLTPECEKQFHVCHFVFSCSKASSPKHISQRWSLQKCTKWTRISRLKTYQAKHKEWFSSCPQMVMYELWKAPLPEPRWKSKKFSGRQRQKHTVSFSFQGCSAAFVHTAIPQIMETAGKLGSHKFNALFHILF